nr:FKBP-type peptidyl-prolyl cis-trans isomerase [Tenuifilaceae bacterium]
FFACDKEFSDLEGDEMAKLNAWVQVNNIPAEALKPSGLYYISIQEGADLSPESGDYVIYSYKEKKLDGVIVDSDSSYIAKLYDLFEINYHYTPVFTKFDNSNMVVEGYNRYMLEGLYEGLSYMKEGGKATLIIPSSLAYGSSGRIINQNTKINSFESLIYEVELHKVVKNPRNYEKSILQAYIDANYSGLEQINDSIYYVQLAPPTADTVTVGKDSVVYVYYKGMFLDGFVFDTNIDSVATKLGRTFSSEDSLKVTIGQGVVAGFSQALTQMKKGEWGRAILPSYCGYDSTGNSSIPPFTPLIFDIYFSSKVVQKKPSE